MILIYRIEHPKDKMGPYTSDHVSLEVDEMKMHHCASHVDHPSPKKEFGDYPSIEFIFAMNNRKNLKKWFDGYLPDIAKCGFEVKVYKINRKDCSIGKSGQVMFDRQFAAFIKTMPISAL